MKLFGFSSILEYLSSIEIILDFGYYEKIKYNSEDYFEIGDKVVVGPESYRVGLEIYEIISFREHYYYDIAAIVIHSDNIEQKGSLDILHSSDLTLINLEITHDDSWI